jgi:beta-lactamase class A
MPTRRGLLAQGLGIGLAGALPAFAADVDAAFEREVAAIQNRVTGTIGGTIGGTIDGTIDGTIGVAALDTANQRWLVFNADRRMAMCSVFKLPLAAAVAAKVDAGKLRWEQPVRFTRKDLVPYAPVVEAISRPAR